LILPCAEYSVLNTIYMSRGERSGLAAVPWEWLNFRSFAGTMEARGFLVKSEWSSTRASIQKSLGQADFHGWFFMGHGDPNSGAVYDADGKPIADTEAAGWVHRKLGVVYMNACYAGYPSAQVHRRGPQWWLLVSKYGQLYATDSNIRVPIYPWWMLPEAPPLREE
jgi:hypothetical protein